MVRFGSKIVYPTDPEDVWGNINKVGNAELAARLGSIVSYDRRGNVVFLENFESPILHWQTEESEAGFDIALTKEWARTSSQSCRLTAGAGAGGAAVIDLLFGALYAGKLGIEATFTLTTATKEVRLILDWFDGTHRYDSLISYNNLLNKFYYMDYQEHAIYLPDVIKLENTYKTWHTMKYVVDTATGKYVRLMINNNTIDMTDIGVYITTPPVISPILVSAIGHYSDHSLTKSIYVDNIIITQNEP